MALLSRLAARGLAVAAVLHEPGVARLGCTRALTAGAGGKWTFGPAAELLRPERLAGVYGVPPDSPLLA
jgi:ABC-type cobalamin/Fe3+-siderophores transport system ATPase subunit